MSTVTSGPLGSITSSSFSSKIAKRGETYVPGVRHPASTSIAQQAVSSIGSQPSARAKRPAPVKQSNQFNVGTPQTVAVVKSVNASSSTSVSTSSRSTPVTSGGRTISSRTTTVASSNVVTPIALTSTVKSTPAPQTTVRTTTTPVPAIITTPIPNSRIIRSLQDTVGLSQNFYGQADVYQMGQSHMEKRIEIFALICDCITKTDLTGYTIGKTFRGSHYYVCDPAAREDGAERAHISVIPNLPLVKNGKEENLSAMVTYNGKSVPLHQVLNACDIVPAFINKIDDQVETHRGEISTLLNKVRTKEITKDACVLKVAKLFKKTLKTQQRGIEKDKIDENAPIMQEGSEFAKNATQGMLRAINEFLRANDPDAANTSSSSTEVESPVKVEKNEEKTEKKS